MLCRKPEFDLASEELGRKPPKYGDSDVRGLAMARFPEDLLGEFGVTAVWLSKGRCAHKSGEGVSVLPPPPAGPEKEPDMAELGR